MISLTTSVTYDECQICCPQIVNTTQSLGLSTCNSTGNSFQSIHQMGYPPMAMKQFFINHGVEISATPEPEPVTSGCAVCVEFKTLRFMCIQNTYCCKIYVHNTYCDVETEP